MRLKYPFGPQSALRRVRATLILWQHHPSPRLAQCAPWGSLEPTASTVKKEPKVNIQLAHNCGLFPRGPRGSHLIRISEWICRAQALEIILWQERVAELTATSTDALIDWIFLRTSAQVEVLTNSCVHLQNQGMRSGPRPAPPPKDSNSSQKKNKKTK